jgi:hypothetical protein
VQLHDQNGRKYKKGPSKWRMNLAPPIPPVEMRFRQATTRFIHYSQIFRPASPCAHSWPQVEAFAHAPLDREMTQPESGIHLRARNTGGLRGIALI